MNRSATLSIINRPRRTWKLLFLAASLLPLSANAKTHFWDHLKIGKDYLADEVVVEIVESPESIKYEHAGKTWKEKVARGNQTNEAQQLIQLANSLGCKLVKKLGTLPFFEFKIPKDTNPTEICDAFEEHLDLVKETEPNGLLQKASYIPYSFPNDPYYQDGSTQWNLNITQLDEAWNTTTGNMDVWSQGTSSTVIATIDSGANTTHQDLINQLITGYNVLDGSSNVTDDDDHGTAVASIASVSTNNGVGVAGGAMNCKILPVKILDTGLVNFANAATGVNWAANNSANIINMSFVGTTDWAPLNSACQSAYYDDGIVLVAASGNFGTNAIEYPASYNCVIAVSASDSADQWSNYSDYGSYLLCGAPSGIEGCDIGSNTAYANWTGTSVSSPGVAALGAILLSNGVPFYECVSRIAETCDKIDTATHAYVTTAGYSLGTWNEYMGYGRINYYRAMETLVPPTLSTATPGIGAVTLSWTAPTLFNTPTTAYDIYRATVSGGPYTLVGTVPSSQTSYTDVSNQGGFPFYYVVKALDSNSFLTRYSNELSATPIAPTPSSTPSFTPSLTPSPSQTPTASPTASPTLTATGTFTITPSDTSTPTPTWSPSSTPSTTETPTPTWSPSDTPSDTNTSTSSPTPSISPTDSSTDTPSSTPSVTDTSTPTATPTFSPGVTFTATATDSPSSTPSSSPTTTPSVTPTLTPTPTSSVTPSISPSFTPGPVFSATFTPIQSSPTPSASLSRPVIQILEIVPNPLGSNSGLLMLKLQGNATHISYQVFTPGYTLVQEVNQDWVAQPGWDRLPIDSHSWPNGILFLKVTVQGEGGSSSARTTVYMTK